MLWKKFIKKSPSYKLAFSTKDLSRYETHVEFCSLNLALLVQFFFPAEQNLHRINLPTFNGT